MSCKRPVFFPGGPCCGGALCLKWPRIDWSAFTWLVRTPDAEWIETDTVYGFRTGLLNYYTWNSDDTQLRGFSAHNSIADVGTDFPIYGPDLLFGRRGHYYRGGSFLAKYTGGCAWSVSNRENLVHRFIAMLTAEFLSVPSFYDPDSPSLFYASAATLLTPDQLAVWDTKRVVEPDISFVFEGIAFTSGFVGDFPNTQFVSIRDVLQRLACYWLPYFEQRGDVGQLADLYFSPLAILNSFKNLDPATWPKISTLYKPTAIELAAAVALSPGFLFGFVSDPRSPLFDRFTCFEGAEYSEDGENEPFLQSVPWELSTGPEVVAELDHVNRFERTNENEALPDWIELELVRV